MLLRGDIVADRPLVVVALDEEATHLHLSGIPVLVTGVGKVNAAVAVSAVLAATRPAYVINVGTAGALHDRMPGVHVIDRVVQHDLDNDAIVALTGRVAAEPIWLRERPPAAALTLATGDAFISDPVARQRLAQHAHLVDMEGYAVAHAARAARVEAILVKVVSDSADGSAARSWRETVQDCAEVLGGWLRDHLG